MPEVMPIVPYMAQSFPEKPANQIAVRGASFHAPKLPETATMIPRPSLAYRRLLPALLAVLLAPLLPVMLAAFDLQPAAFEVAEVHP